MKRIDAKGLLCPKPLIMTKNEIDKKEDNEFEVVVDNDIAVQNLEKFAKNSNYDFNFEKISEKEFVIKIRVNEFEVVKEEKNDEENVVIFVTKDYMGEGSKELGKKLLNGFIYTVKEYEKKPKTMIFLNDGVKITTTGSECIDDLKALENSGVHIISCGTCLDYNELKNNLEVGEISNMYTIYELLYNADKVINI